MVSRVGGLGRAGEGAGRAEGDVDKVENGTLRKASPHAAMRVPRSGETETPSHGLKTGEDETDRARDEWARGGTWSLPASLAFEAIVLTSGLVAGIRAQRADGRDD